MIPIVVLAIAASVALLVAGYLFGARSGREARSALRQDAEGQAARVVELEARLSARVDPNEKLQRDLLDAVQRRETENESFREEIRGLLTNLDQKAQSPGELQKEVQRAMSTLTAQRTDGTNEVRRIMNDILGPMLDRERVGRELSTIKVGSNGLGELPKLVDAIGQKGGFAAVVLSDESGLPLAASSGATEVESLSAIAAFFLTLADRASHASHPRPISCVILDDTNRMTLHRVFSVGNARFTLSAVSRGNNLAPGALDGALSPIERALTSRRELS